MVNIINSRPRTSITTSYNEAVKSLENKNTKLRYVSKTIKEQIAIIQEGDNVKLLVPKDYKL